MRIGDKNKRVVIQAQKSGNLAIISGSGIDFSSEAGMIGIDGSAAVRIPGIDLSSYAGASSVYAIKIIDSVGNHCTGYILAADTAEHYE